MAVLQSACSADVPIGAWQTLGSENEGPTNTNADDATGGAGGEPNDAGAMEVTTQPECMGPVEFGELSPAGPTVGATLPYTDWSWAAPMDSVAFDLEIETDVPADGFFWAYQFSFVAGPTGLFGLQDQARFQSDPPDGPITIEKTATLWISSVPLLISELGDVDYPDARISLEYARGVTWTTIVARYAWEPCRTYRVSLVYEETDPGGHRWLAARIADVGSDEETLLGRVLIPAPWGQMSAFSSMYTDRTEESPPASCDDIEYASAIFGTPIADGSVVPRARHNRFAVPARCPTSRTTEFDGAVRQEIGVEN